ncbi:MAG TPA: hypothetical protein VN681_00295 [Stellaceae bacterium]|nr:hypothetical protein [Stellaceae bacterium]
MSGQAVWQSPAMVLLTLFSTALYLGLAVLGWGGIDAFFAHPARIALALVLAALVVAGLFSRGNLSRGLREDRDNRWVLAAFALLGLLGAWLPAWTDRTGFWTIDGDAVRWLGVALFAAGGALRLWPVFVLGRRFSGLVAIKFGPLEYIEKSAFLAVSLAQLLAQPNHYRCASRMPAVSKVRFGTESVTT